MITDTKRTKTIHFYLPFNGEVRFDIDRETIRDFGDGNAFALPDGGRTVRRAMADVLSDQVPGAPAGVTYAVLQDIIISASAALAAEDEAAEAAMLAQRAQQPVLGEQGFI